MEKFPSVQMTFGSDQLELPEQVVLAVVDLLRQRVAVAGRPALQDVGDEHVAALEADLAQQLVEQPPGLADERQAALVLAGAGRLADEHQVGVGVAGAEDDGLRVEASCGQRWQAAACCQTALSSSRRSRPHRSRPRL